MSENNYEHDPINPADIVTEPEYARLIDWVESASGAALSLDFWARGNYVRRLLWHRQNQIQPLVVSASSMGELRWAYQRLALLGLPIELIYSGATQGAGTFSHLHPRDDTVDCGWGYIAATQDCQHNGKDWFPIVGWADPLPEDCAEWLLVESRRAFSSGRLMLAPAGHIGFPAVSSDEAASALNQIVGGIPVANQAATEALLNLDIPYLDGMTSTDFDEFLADHEDDLEELRAAVRALLRSDEHIPAAERLSAAVEELVRSDRGSRFRDFSSKLGGSLKTFPVAMGSLAAASAGFSLDPFAGAAALGIAGESLRRLWNSSTGSDQVEQSPFRLFVELGVTKRTKSHPLPQPVKIDFEFPAPESPYHWLTPPSGGMFWLFRKSRGEQDEDDQAAAAVDSKP